MGKPEAVVYRRALDALGVSAGPTCGWWAITWSGMWLALQRAGLQAAWIDRLGAGLPPGTAVRPDRILRALGELTRATVAP